LCINATFGGLENEGQSLKTDIRINEEHNQYYVTREIRIAFSYEGKQSGHHT